MKRDLHLALDLTHEKSQIQKFAVENLDFPRRLFYSDMLECFNGSGWYSKELYKAKFFLGPITWRIASWAEISAQLTIAEI